MRRFTKKVFLIINIITGFLFIAGANVKFFNPDKYWFLSLLTLILPYLIAVLLIFFVFWLLVKPFNSLFSLICIALGWSAVINILPMRVSSKFDLAKKPNTIRVLSWNVELFNILNHKTHPEKREAMLELINTYDPDIACLQEVVAGETPKAINFFPDIESKLKFSDYFYAYNLKNDFDKYHHFGTLIFSKYPILRKQSMVNNPNDYNSTFQFIDVLIGNDTVRIFNVHLQSLKFTEENLRYIDSGKIETNAANESKSVIEKIKTGIEKRAVQANFVKDEMNHTPYPLILCGDFNDVPVSYAYETLGKNLQNAFVKKGSGISRTYASISPTLRIDNIFADSSFSILQFATIKKDLSDHFPIVADLELKSQARK